MPKTAQEAVQTPEDQYHLNELLIALDSTNPAHFLPKFQTGERVLDIGCGAGQTLIAACPYRLPGEGGGCVTCARKDDICLGWAHGIDIDKNAIRMGKAWSRILQLKNASAEDLPYEERYFDVVISRVALVYVDMRTALREIRGVLRPGRRIWFTLYPFSMVTQQVPRRNWRGFIYLMYVGLNGLLFNLTLRTLPFFGDREYWQSCSAMKRILSNYGFEDIQTERKRYALIVSARLAAEDEAGASRGRGTE